MKILYFTQLFYPKIFGGGEYLFYQWSKELKKKGHQVFVIAQNLQDTKSYETIDRIKIFRVGSKISGSGTLPIGIGQNLSYLFSSYFKGIKVIKEHKIDLIHSNTYIPVISAQWCSNKTKIPHIATVHDVYLTSKKDFWKNWSNQQKTSSLTKCLGPYIEKKIVKTNVTLFHTVSEQSKSDIESLGTTKKIAVIPNGIDPSIYENGKTSENQIIFIGRLVFYKNLEVVIDAFSKVITKIPDVKLVIIGDGPMKDSLVKKTKSLKLQDNIIFKGNVSEQEKIKLLQQSQVLVNPSLVEGFGIVVLEEFASSKPVIVSDSKPLSDLVDDSVDGFVVSSTNSSAWAEKIVELLSNPDKGKKMGEEGRKKVVSKYNISKLSDDLISLYEEVLR